jgi:nucleotide-binding universal stress UspA family protein
MKNILVSTDFSAASHDAVNYAVSLAQAFGAALTIINAITPPIIVDDSLLAPVMITQAEVIEEHKRSMEQEIETLSKKYAKINGFVEEGYALDIIPKWTKEKRVGLTVMGMKGKGRSNSVFGSTTTALIQRCSFPVLVIPESASFRPVDHITFASDFDTTIEIDRYTALLDIAGQFNSHINIINVQKKKSPLNEEKAIGKMKTGLAFWKQKHQFHIIHESRVEEGINRFIGTNPTDMLTMVAHKHSLFERLFGKVHTKAMSYQTEIPLLVLQSE